MINEERTFAEIGKHSWELSAGSNDKVWRICEGCGKEDSVKYSNYISGKKICSSCAGKNKKSLSRGPFNIEYFTTIQESINDGYINELKMFNEFKYYSIDLLYGSGKRVWRICEWCGKESKVEYKSYTSEHKICGSCAHKGKHHSEETKRKMSATKQNKTYEEWESFATNSPYCPKFNEAIKESNREKYGRRCFLCNKPEEENITSTGKHKKLSVHHVDMNKDQGCNGHRWKLVPLCMWCHGTGHVKRMISYIEYILKLENIKFSIHSTKREQTRRGYKY